MAKVNDEDILSFDVNRNRNKDYFKEIILEMLKNNKPIRYIRLKYPINEKLNEEENKMFNEAINELGIL